MVTPKNFKISQHMSSIIQIYTQPYPTIKKVRKRNHLVGMGISPPKRPISKDFEHYSNKKKFINVN